MSYDPSAPVLNSRKCEQRNRIAAHREGVNSAPFHLLQEGEYNLAEQESQPGLLYARGTLPQSDDEALTRINALSKGKKPLSQDDVWIHYAEAANDNYVRKYTMFLGDTTLRNIATDASQGVAFMNSHRTGGLSAPSELAYGKTFSGRYEEFTDGRKRAVVGMYMLQGVKPNGDSGPSTDDLHRMIEGSTAEKVSVGLKGGTAVCDLCGCELGMKDQKTGQYLCPHAPGTKRGMTSEHVAGQKARGVEDGTASYTLHAARMGEVSAVYAGAVPGAGFQKALGLAHEGCLNMLELGQARSAYSALLSEGDFRMMMNANADMEEYADAALSNPSFVDKLAIALGLKGRAAQGSAVTHTGTLDPITEQAPVPLTIQATETPEYKQLKAERDAMRLEVIERGAKQFAEGQRLANKILPAEEGELSILHRQMALDDAAAPVSISLSDTAGGEDVQLTGRVALLERFLSKRPAHQLTQELMATDMPLGASLLKPLSAGGDVFTEGVEAGKKFVEQNYGHRK